MNKVIMCATSELLNNPRAMNLPCSKEELQNFDWLTCFSDGNIFRQYCAQIKDSAEIWVISADNIDAVNLAAAIKLDSPELPVCVVAFDVSGSLQSRANAAHINTVMTAEIFAERFLAYAQMKSSGVIQKVEGHVSNKGFALNSGLLSTEESRRQGFLLPIVSATGGAGKSVVSVMAAILSQLSGHKTLLLDANLQFSELSSMLPAKNVIAVDELLSTPNKLLELEPTETMPAVLSAPTKAELAETASAELPKLVDSLRETFEVIVVNTATYWNELLASFLDRASKALFVVDQRPSSLSATKSAIDLCTRCGIATTSFLYAVNRCKKGALYSAVDVSCALGGVSVAEIVDGKIDVDNAFMSATPLELIENKNSFALSMWNIVNSILPSAKAEAGNVQISGRAGKKSKFLSSRGSNGKKRDRSSKKKFAKCG